MTIKAGESDSMTFRKLFMLSILVGLTETLQTLDFYDKVYHLTNNGLISEK